MLHCFFQSNPNNGGIVRQSAAIRLFISFFIISTLLFSLCMTLQSRGERRGADRPGVIAIKDKKETMEAGGLKW